MIVDADKAEHQEGRAAHKHKGQLHGAVLLAACTPESDEKVHRDECDLIEHEHGEKVDRDEEAIDTCREENQPEEEFLGLGNFPRSEATGYKDNTGQDKHGDRNAVDTHRKVDVERCEPLPRVNPEHGFGSTGGAEGEIVDKKPDGESSQCDRARDGHCTNLLDVPAEGEPQHHDEGYHHKVN